MKKQLFIHLIFLLIGCSNAKMKLLYAVYGIKQPKELNSSEIIKYANKIKLNNYEHYSISKKGFIYLSQSKESVNSMFIFNHNLNQIKPKKFISCSADNIEFIQNFTDSTKVIVLQNDSTSKVYQHIKSIEGNDILINSDEFDYLIILTWAKFIGKLNKTNTLTWSQKLTEITFEGKKIKVIYLNLDPREFWNKE